MRIFYFKLFAYVIFCLLCSSYSVCGIKSYPFVEDTCSKFIFITSILGDKEYILCSASTNGVIKSTNNGDSWYISNHGFVLDNDNDIIGIEKHKDRIYCWTLKGRLYFSNDNAMNWVNYSSFFENKSIAINNITFQDSLVYLSTDDGIYFSSNNGGVWEKKDGFNKCCYGSIYSFKDTLYISNNAVYYKYNLDNDWDSLDYIPKLEFIFPDIAFLGNKLFLATDLGVFYTLDRGKTWTDITFGLQIPSGGYEGIIRIFAVNNHIYMCKNEGLFLLNEPNNCWFKCNLIFNSQNPENAFPWIINEYAGFYYLGCNGAGIFRSEDGINYYNLNNIDWLDNK